MMTSFAYFLIILSFATFIRANEESHASVPCLGCSQSREEGGGLFSKQIKAIVEKVRQQLEDGIPSLGIPPMNPLRVESFSSDFNSSFISGPLTVTNLEVQGITDFVLTDGKVIPALRPILHFGLRFDFIELTTEYAANLRLVDLADLYGTGKIGITFSNIDIALKAYLSGLQKPTIKDVDIHVTLPTTEAKITGLLDDEFMSDIISRQLTDTLSFLAKEEEERINAGLYEVVMYIVEEIINPILENRKSGKEDDEDYHRLALTAVEQTIQILNDNDFFLTWFVEKLYNMRKY